MLIEILIVLVVAGVALYLLNTLVPMDGKFKTAINAIVGLVLFLWILSFFGYLPAAWVLTYRVHR